MARLWIASSLVLTAMACSGSYRGGSDGGGGEGGAADASQEAGDASGAGDASDLTCTSQARAQCKLCCAQLHAGGYQKLLQYGATCACVNPGGCQAQCATEFCANPPKDSQSGGACETCASNVGCGAQVSTACNNDATCKPYLTCALACP